MSGTTAPENYVTRTRGGNPDFIFNNEVYCNVLLSNLNSECSRLETFLKIGVFLTEFPINEPIRTYISSLITFLSSPELKEHIHNIDKTQPTQTYKYELSSWMPQHILFMSNDMNISYHFKNRVYYIPHKLRKVFPYQPDSISLPGNTFSNVFKEGTFYDFVKINITLPPDPTETTNTQIPLNDKLEFKEILYYLKSFNNSDTDQFLKDGVNSINNIDFVQLLSDSVDVYNLKDADIVKFIFNELIPDTVISSRIYNLFTSLLYFKGLYVFDYEIVLEFINIINRESNGLEFVGGAVRLDTMTSDSVPGTIPTATTLTTTTLTTPTTTLTTPTTPTTLITPTTPTTLITPTTTLTTPIIPTTTNKKLNTRKAQLTNNGRGRYYIPLNLSSLRKPKTTPLNASKPINYTRLRGNRPIQLPFSEPQLVSAYGGRHKTHKKRRKNTSMTKRHRKSGRSKRRSKK
jgi:hypothetical protein